MCFGFISILMRIRYFASNYLYLSLLLLKQLITHHKLWRLICAIWASCHKSLWFKLKISFACLNRMDTNKQTYHHLNVPSSLFSDQDSLNLLFVNVINLMSQLSIEAFELYWEIASQHWNVTICSAINTSNSSNPLTIGGWFLVELKHLLLLMVNLKSIGLNDAASLLGSQ